MWLSPSVETSVEFDELLVSLETITFQLTQCHHLDDLLKCATELTRRLFDCDRVLIYQFVKGGDGAVTAESTTDNWLPMLGQLIYDPCFEVDWSNRFRQGELRAIPDVEQADLDPCYAELMRRCQVRANLVSPIRIQPLPDKRTSGYSLWGLLIIHQCDGPRDWHPLHYRVIKHIAMQLGLVIQQLQLIQQLAQQEHEQTQWQAALEAAEYGAWDWHLPTHQLLWSPQWKAMLGYTHDDISGAISSWEALIHPDDYDRVQAAIAQHLANQTPVYRCEYRLRCKDGSWCWVLSQGQVTERHANGEPIRFMGLIVDISDRKTIEARLRQQEEDFRTLVENNPDGILRVNRQFQVLYVNPILESRTGLSKAKCIGKTFAEIGMPEPIITQWQAAIADVFATGQERLLETQEPLALTQHTFYSRIVPELQPDGEIGSVLIISRDMTNLRAAQEALTLWAEREHTLRLITQHMRETLELEDVLSTAADEVQRSLHADRTVIFRMDEAYLTNVIAETVQSPWPAMLELDWAAQALTPECYASYRQGQGRIVPDVSQDKWGADCAEFMARVGVQSKMVAPIIQRLETGPVVWGLLITHACEIQRQWQSHELSLLQQVADQLAIAIQQSELHQRLQAANLELERLSTTDALTQIANRRHFDDVLNQEWLRAQREQRQLALVLCDIDHFKQYNDTFGHLAGDRCIATVAQTLQECINRPTDCLARYGGEEFAVILPHTDVEGATVIVQKMQRALATLNIEHTPPTGVNRVTLSFGIAVVVPQPTHGPGDLIDQADRALYQAKQSGRDRYAIATGTNR
jgi:diguanylate cyclase (GGDEF)-like protein/PAS domain S-box-containing protein